MDEQFLYLTTTGRQSGQLRQIEIWFVEHEGRYYLVAETRERAHWVQNILHNPAVRFSIGSRAGSALALPPTPGRGRIVSPEEEPTLVGEVRALMDAKYGWSDGLIVELTPL